MLLDTLDAAIDAAFATAAAQNPPLKVPASEIAPGVTLRTDTYKGPRGAGFQVVCVLKSSTVTVSRVKQSGPETFRARDWNMALVKSWSVQILDDLFNSLPIEQQAAFSAEYVAVKDFLSRGKTDVARQIVESTAVPDNLSDIKQKMLTLLS